MDATKRCCYMILPGQMSAELGYIPSLVEEDVAGHSPMLGNGEQSQPWYWGTDYDKAKAICDEANLKDFGLTPEEAALIVASSMRAENLGEAKVAAHRVRMAEAQGRRPDVGDRLLAGRLEDD